MENGENKEKIEKKKGKKEGISLNWTLLVIAIAIIVVVCLLVRKNKNENSANTLNTTNTNNNAISVENSNGETNEVENEKYVEKTEDGTKVNTSSKINEDRQIGDLKFTNFQLTTQDGQSTLLANVENTSNKDITEETNLNITFLAEDGSEIVTIAGLLPQIKAGQSTQLNAGLTQDIANAYDVKISKK